MANVAIAFWIGGALVDAFHLWRMNGPEGWLERVSLLCAAICWPIAWCWVAWNEQEAHDG